MPDQQSGLLRPYANAQASQSTAESSATAAAFGKSDGTVANAVLGDWRCGTIVSLRGGFPVSMIQFGNDPTGAYFQPRPDRLAASVAMTLRITF